LNNIEFEEIFDRKEIQHDKATIVLEPKKGYFEDDIYAFSFNNINFDNIKIRNNIITYKNKKIIFSEIHDEVKRIYFHNCTFRGVFACKGYTEFGLKFKNCFIESMSFVFISIREENKSHKLSNTIDFVNTNINFLHIYGSTFHNKFYFNNQNDLYTKKNMKAKIGMVSIKESTFNENFKIHKTEIENIDIKGVDFKKNVDFFKSVFINGKSDKKGTSTTDIVFNGININGLSIFEECDFKQKLILKYVTFSGLAQFREATFNKGFNLDRTNTEKEMNFYAVKGLDTEKSIKETSQETYRIIKYNCQRIGSIIDANRYHTLELQKRKEELGNYVGKDFNKIFLYDTDEKIYHGSWFDWIIFKINWHSSKFGTSWIRTLILIMLVGIITPITMYPKEFIFLLDNVSFIFENKVFFLTIIFKYMAITNYEVLKEYPIIFFFNKVSLGYLYYQFVTAVRKDTRK